MKPDYKCVCVCVTKEAPCRASQQPRVSQLWDLPGRMHKNTHKHTTKGMFALWPVVVAPALLADFFYCIAFFIVATYSLCAHCCW